MCTGHPQQCQAMAAGIKQKDAAEQALKAIFLEKQPVHRITLRNQGPKGRTWTLFEMWTAEVSPFKHCSSLVSAASPMSEKMMPPPQLPPCTSSLVHVMAGMFADFRQWHLRSSSYLMKFMSGSGCRSSEAPDGLQTRVKKRICCA